MLPPELTHCIAPTSLIVLATDSATRDLNAIQAPAASDYEIKILRFSKVKEPKVFNELVARLADSGTRHKFKALIFTSYKALTGPGSAKQIRSLLTQDRGAHALIAFDGTCTILIAILSFGILFHTMSPSISIIWIGVWFSYTYCVHSRAHSCLTEFHKMNKVGRPSRHCTTGADENNDVEEEQQDYESAMAMDTDDIDTSLEDSTMQILDVEQHGTESLSDRELVNSYFAFGGKVTGQSQTSVAAVALQLRLPHAKVLYVSATGASEVSEIAVLVRSGLWGQGASPTRTFL